MTLTERDRNYIWHPFTQEKTAKPAIVIKKAEDCYIYDENDTKYLDLVSSWWVNLHGHANPKIAQAIYEQATQLEHVIFAGFTHAPAVDLCTQLAHYLPENMTKFFFSDNGSTSTEIALKMAYQYFVNTGEGERHLFLSFAGSYHGDTFGAMGVGNTNYHTIFKNICFKSLVVPYPETWWGDENIAEKEKEALRTLDNYLEDHGKEIAAFILEPLVQGASGMRMCRPEFLNKILDKVRKAGILIIFDEVMTGFGRTGKLFALEHLKFFPDILCLSKGITGGFLPLALTVTTNKIYEAFWHDDWNYAFAHGHSYTANPIACAAANASLKLTIQALKEGMISNLEDQHKAGLYFLAENCQSIEHIRTKGTIAAFDLKEKFLGKNLQEIFFNRGLLLRPLGKTIYLLPPYTISDKDLCNAYELICHEINKL